MLVWGLLEEYGWWILGAAVASLWLVSLVKPAVQRWMQAREDALYHKDPDVALKRMEAIQRARERQQELLQRESELAKQREKEREEKKRAEVAALLSKGGAGAGAAGGNRLGSGSDYLPLSGGAGASNYRPPKKSKCGGGGCGR